MKAYDLADLAARNLRQSLLRNSLTTVGISVGVASLVAMLSLGIGLQQLASRRLQKSGLFDTVVVMSRRDLRNFNREQQNSGPAPADSPALDEAARQQIERLPNVREAYPGSPKSAGESRLTTRNEADDLPQASYSVFFREQKLKIVGLSDLDPDSMRGAARARVFLPLTLAEDLHVMQPSNLRDTSRTL